MLNDGPGVVLSTAPFLSCSGMRINTGLSDISEPGELQGNSDCFDKGSLCHSVLATSLNNKNNISVSIITEV